MKSSDSLLKQRTFWNEQYSEDLDLWGSDPSQCLELTLPYFIKNNVRKVVDVGCGYGRDNFHLLAKGINSYGVDVSGNGIELAKKQKRSNGWPKFIVLEGLNLPFQNESIEGINSHRMFHLLPTSQRIFFVKEVCRILKSGGILGLTARETDASNLAESRYVTKELKELTFRPGHIINTVTRENLKSLFSDYFEILEIKQIEENDRENGLRKIKLLYILCKRL